jgi:hypothetical protein
MYIFGELEKTEEEAAITYFNSYSGVLWEGKKLQ